MKKVHIFLDSGDEKDENFPWLWGLKQKIFFLTLGMKKMNIFLDSGNEKDEYFPQLWGLKRWIFSLTLRMKNMFIFLVSRDENDEYFPQLWKLQRCIFSRLWGWRWKGCLASKIFMHFGRSITSKDVFINTKVCFNLFGKQICLKVHTIDANE